MQPEESKEPKRGAILQAAAEMFAVRRFDAVKLDEIAAAAGVGKGTLYLYFENKEDLFAQMAVDGLDEMAECVRAIAAQKSPYKERLFLFGRELADFLTQRHAVTKLMAQVQSVPADRLFRKHLGKLIEAIHELLRQGVDEGILRNDFTAAELRCALVGPILLKVRRKAHSDENIELAPLLELFWAGAAVRKK